MMNHILYWAKKYINMGWSVIPIPARSKFPTIKWKEYQTRQATNQELLQWFSNMQNQIGIVTGSISKLTVLDADSQQAYQALKEKGIVSCITARTRRGYHLYFKYCPNLKTITEWEGIKNVDIRSDGGLVVAAPSMGYSWTNPNFRLDRLPEFPNALLEKDSNPSGYTDTSSDRGWIGEALRGLGNGNRDNTFTKIIGRLRTDGHRPNDIYEILIPHAVRVGFDTGALKEKIDYAEKTYPREGHSKSITIYSTRDNWKDYEERKASKNLPEGPEIKAGFNHLDSLLYGLRRGELYTVGARTGIGKTSFCVNISANLLKQSKRVLFLSTEMSYDTIWSRLEHIFPRLSDSAFYTSDVSSPSKSQIEQMIKEVQPDVLILDHIQHMGDSLTGRYQELSKLIKGFKDLARENNIVIITASQLNRSADFIDKSGQQTKPKLYHLKECGSIEEESTAVMLLHREGLSTDGTDFYVLNLAKNRYGQCGEIQISFNKKTGLMREV